MSNPEQVTMVEAVRLVVWDLDETFWDGTLTEGGIAYRQDHHDIVVELARRGIMNSICSKNDFTTVKAVLEERGLWSYFIFPSINWEPKGPRLAALIETVGLRPETVMLIDDNPLNLNEALYFTPTLQTANETFIPSLLADPGFGGKDDRELTRLAQYKLLESRNADAMSVGDNLAFLRESDVRVSIDADIEAHIDRAVELINRTNQLNFTKTRLPEAPEAARAALRALISRFDVQAGLVRVTDRYGDYGFAGLYLVELNSVDPKRNALTHFCFSCRTLDMGIEAFIYDLLGRPALRVVGEVLSDPVNDSRPDWIAFQDTAHDGDSQAIRPLSGLYLRGGCDMGVIAHYGRMIADAIVGEYNTVRGDIPLRLDHTVVARLAIEGTPPGAMEALMRIGYSPDDFRSPLFDAPQAGVWVLSYYPDYWTPLYRHNVTGCVVPYFVGIDDIYDPSSLTADERRIRIEDPYRLEAANALAEEFTYLGRIGEALFTENLDLILKRIPRGSRVFLVLQKPYEGLVDLPEKRSTPITEVNSWTERVAGAHDNVSIVSMGRFVKDPGDMASEGHYHRLVYRRLFNHIRDEALAG